MIDVWMIFTMTVPLFEILGHSYSGYLKKELAKNHPNDHLKDPPNDHPMDRPKDLPKNHTKDHPDPKLSTIIEPLPRNPVSVHPHAPDQSEHSYRRSEAMLCWFSHVER